MATVRITDVIVPEIFNPYMLKETMITADIFNSGLVMQNADMAAKLAGGGITFQTPSWNDLSDNNEAEIGSDNPAEEITPDKLTAYKMLFRRQFRTKAWSDADLTAELAGDDPMARIVSRVSAWWGRSFDRMAIATMNGVINANVASNSGDFTYVCGVGTGGSTTPTAALNGDSLIDAAQTMGDKSGMMDILCIHSVVHANLLKRDEIDFIPESEGKKMLQMYKGRRLVVTDNLPVTLISAGNYAYTSYLSTPGIMGFGESPPDVPVATQRYEGQGNGAGVEILYTRRQFALHPLGHTWNESSVAKQFPTNAELQTAANWTRKFPERKQTPFVAILSKNG